MTKKTLLAGSIATALFSASVLAGPPSDPDNAILVMFKPGVSKQERQNIIHNQGASLRQLDEHGRDLKMRYVADGRIVARQPARRRGTAPPRRRRNITCSLNE